VLYFGFFSDFTTCDFLAIILYPLKKQDTNKINLKIKKIQNVLYCVWFNLILFRICRACRLPDGSQGRQVSCF